MVVLLMPRTSHARYLNTGTGRFQTMDTFQGNNEDPLSLHKYLYGADNPVNNEDPNGHDYGDFDIRISSIGDLLAKIGNPVTTESGLGAFGTSSAIVGFFGADVWGSGDSNEGNQKMRAIANSIHCPIYRSLDIWDPYQYLLSTVSSSSPDEPIKIFGHSWGGISAVKLARWVGRSPLRNHEIDVYTIDPVSTLRFPPTSVPSCVSYFWNRYETHGNGVTILGHPVHGTSLTSYAQTSDQLDLNPGSGDNGIDHFSIIDQVEPELMEMLKK